MANPLVKNIPVVGSIYGFTSTAVDVYNSTSISGASRAAIKGILADCTPPEVKYPILCGALVLNGVVCIVTGFNPIAVTVFVHNGRLIVEA